MILNLKPFNQQYVDKIHFKMESLKSELSMPLNCYFERSSLLIRIREVDRKCSRFYWRGQKYQFQVAIV